jgi:hypothetical protein
MLISFLAMAANAREHGWYPPWLLLSPRLSLAAMKAGDREGEKKGDGDGDGDGEGEREGERG